MLSPTIKNQVTKHIFTEAFLMNDIFKNEENTINNVIIGLIPCLMRPEDSVIT